MLCLWISLEYGIICRRNNGALLAGSIFRFSGTPFLLQSHKKRGKALKLSLAMIVKNEEEKLKRCLNSVKNHVDELVIVDTGSTDATKEIALTFGAKIFDFTWCGDFSKARNFSIEKTTGDYVLSMDADQILMKFKKEQALQYMEGKRVLGLAEIVNSYTHNGQKVLDRSYAAAVFPREARYVGPVHEQIDTSYPRVKLPITIFHDGYDHRDESKAKRNIDILEKALQEQCNPYLVYKLAQEYRGIEQLDKADQLFSAAYHTAEKDRSYYPNLVVEYINNLVQIKAYENALEIVRQEEKRFFDYPEFHFVCGALFMELVLSDPQKYIQYFPRIKQSYEKSISIGENPKYQGTVGMGTFLPMHNLGAFYEVTGDMQKAKACYKTAMDMGYEPSKNRWMQIAGKK
jgi:glycosyltransferase involved in cell wall biosynthesis